MLFIVLSKNVYLYYNSITKEINNRSVISVRVSDDEMKVLESASKAYGCKVSSMMKKIVFERLEDEYDLKVFEEYEKEKASGNLKTYTHEEVWEKLGI